MASIKQSKIILRKEINSIVNALTKAEIQRQSDIVIYQVLQHNAYKYANSVSIYLSFDQEVNTSRLLEDIFKVGKSCYIPRFRKSIPDMEMIRLHSLDDYNNLPVNKWNIKQPSDSEDRESVFDAGSLDLVIMPGLAFTADGIRLGRGKGYYDRFLAKCNREFKKSPYTLALSFKEQVVPLIPFSETDVQIDCVLFEGKVPTK